MTEIDGYTDLVEIGRGGFAVVYKARQISVGRDVAIKLLTDPSPDDDLVRRFQRESKAVGALSWHPHIAAVVDAGSTTQGQAFIVFELLPGGSLEDRLDEAPMPWQEAVASMIQVADAVEAAHRADVLHRDIKPANILTDRLGVAKLGDFGIASMQDGTKTETGMLATTVAHAAPELFDGAPSSAATDVYALGSTLHTLVTGDPPFSPAAGERIATTIAHIVSDPPPRPDASIVPEQIAIVIAHALAKQPQYRLRSAAAFGQALQQAQRDLGERVTSMPVSDNEPAVVKPVDPSAKTTKEMNPGATRPAPISQAKAGADAGADSLQNESQTRDVPFVHPDEPDPSGPKPFSRTIALLAAVAAVLAVGVGALLLAELRSGPSAFTRTTGGALIQDYDGLDITEMPAPFDDQKALDKRPESEWGITPVDGTAIEGTSYTIKLIEPQTITHVGIENAEVSELGRVSEIVWGTVFDDDNQLVAPTVVQDVANEAGPQLVPYAVTTDRIVLLIRGVHDDAPTVGIGEILIQVAEEVEPNG